MSRVRLMSLAAVGVMGLVMTSLWADDPKAGQKPGQKQGQTRAEGPKGHDAGEAGGALATMFMDCARECDACARLCDLCSKHCANMLAKGHKGHLQTLATCQDCATICTAAACSTARLGPSADLICQACAESCKRCGDACEKHGHDEVMKRCAEECRRCEKVCRDMVKHAGPGATSTTTTPAR